MISISIVIFYLGSSNSVTGVPSFYIEDIIEDINERKKKLFVIEDWNTVVQHNEFWQKKKNPIAVCLRNLYSELGVYPLNGSKYVIKNQFNIGIDWVIVHR